MIANDGYDLYSEFDIEKHSKHYVNYLEVIILPTGKVVYAIPSHERKVLEIACSKLNCTDEELYLRMKQEQVIDYSEWLCSLTGCIMVWDDYRIGKPNKFQRHKLKELKAAGLYFGKV